MGAEGCRQCRCLARCGGDWNRSENPLARRRGRVAVWRAVISQVLPGDGSVGALSREPPAFSHSPLHPTCACFPAFCYLGSREIAAEKEQKELFFVSRRPVRRGMKADRFMEGYSVFCYFSHFTPRRGILELKETLELIESNTCLARPGICNILGKCLPRV